jgi:hypothetical protein
VTVSRALALLLVFVGVGLWRVHLQSEETRLTARIQELRAEQAELRRQEWALQMELARLRSPDQIRSRADRWRLEVSAPRPDLVDLERDRLASR